MAQGDLGDVQANVLGILNYTSVITRALNFFNVKDYGAKADGVADDSTAIQSTINAAAALGGGIVYFPATLYYYSLLTGFSITQNNITLLGSGNGSLLKLAATSQANGITINGATNMQVCKLMVDGNKGSVSTGGTPYTTINGIYVYNSNNVLIEDCTVTNSYYGGIELDTATNVMVRNCRSYNNRDNGIFLRPACTNVTVQGCHVSGSTYSGIQAIRSTYIHFLGNISYNNGPAPSTEGDGLGFEGCLYSEMIGNIAYGNSTQGIKVDYTVEGGMSSQNSAHILLEGNLLYNNGITDTDAGIEVLRSDYVTVRDNYITENYYGVNVGVVTHCNISGNTIENNTQQGIRCSDNTATGPVTIQNNRIENNGNHGIDVSVTSIIQNNYIQANTNEGIRLSAQNNHVIKGNIILDNTDNGILVGTATNVEVRENFFTNTGSAQARALYEAGGQGPTYMVNNRILNQNAELYHFDHANSRYTDENSKESVIITSNYTMLLQDNVVLCNQSGAITVTLPTSAGKKGHTYTVKDYSGAATTNAITIATTSTQKIDGASTATISTNYGKLTVISDGANWFTV